MPNKGASAVDRFYSFVDKVGPCWLWLGGKSTTGYGHFWVDGKTVGAHRFSYELAHGEFDKELFVCHHCDNPPCVNPEHLFLGTNSDNQLEWNSKFEHVKGYKCKPHNYRGYIHHHTKLGEKEVRLIKEKYIPWKYGCLKLAREFGVSRQRITQILNGRW